MADTGAERREFAGRLRLNPEWIQRPATVSATVHVLPHHRLELQAHTGVTVDVADLEDLHHHLNDWQRHQKQAW